MKKIYAIILERFPPAKSIQNENREEYRIFVLEIEHDNLSPTVYNNRMLSKFVNDNNIQLDNCAIIWNDQGSMSHELEVINKHSWNTDFSNYRNIPVKYWHMYDVVFDPAMEIGPSFFLSRAANLESSDLENTISLITWIAYQQGKFNHFKKITC